MTDDEKLIEEAFKKHDAPTEEDWRAAHQDGGVIFAKVRGSVVPVLLMRGPYGDWSSETKRYRSADVEEVISVYRWVPAGMQHAWASEIVADFRRSEVPEPSADEWDCSCKCSHLYHSECSETCSPEPQGEPSDAQVSLHVAIQAVDAALRSYDYPPSRQGAAEVAVSALRAAGGV
ncbi:hypothetical protein SEA_WHEELIE_10 [Microbacterium phage Wheelie]|nr:hypothetical protein SEA_CASEND_12 [Microbacterium phage Casend]UVG33961.1 hypothetical protein SEA_WHEELIE_10 [Microbacterium phage Wheelie]WNM75529.1 hypothetical protein SEA_WAYNE3_12 [Microbacterium phage Wayne3]